MLLYRVLHNLISNAKVRKRGEEVVEEINNYLLGQKSK